MYSYHDLISLDGRDAPALRWHPLFTHGSTDNAFIQCKVDTLNWPNTKIHFIKSRTSDSPLLTRLILHIFNKYFVVLKFELSIQYLHALAYANDTVDILSNSLILMII